MPRIGTVGNIHIWICYHDTAQHHEPHFHADGPDRGSVLAVADLEVLAGDLRRKELKAVREWAAGHPHLLRDTWNECNPQAPIED